MKPQTILENIRYVNLTEKALFTNFMESFGIDKMFELVELMNKNGLTSAFVHTKTRGKNKGEKIVKDVLRSKFAYRDELSVLLTGLTISDLYSVCYALEDNERGMVAVVLDDTNKPGHKSIENYMDYQAHWVHTYLKAVELLPKLNKSLDFKVDDEVKQQVDAWRETNPSIKLLTGKEFNAKHYA